jgi:hypothetical protein
MSIPAQVVNMIEADNLQELQAWIDEKKSFGARDNNGETLLHKAAYHGAVKVATWLLENGMSANVLDNSGYAPLHEAARHGEPAVIPLLLAHGADLDVKNNGDKTPLDMAKDKDSPETIAILRKAYRAARWFQSGAAEVTEVSYRDQINYKMTQIFNFAARSYILVMQNEKTQAESVTMKTFGDMADRNLIQAAEKAFTDLGGKLPEDYGYMALEKPVAKGLKKSAFRPGASG